MPGLSGLLDVIFPPRCVVCQRVGAMVCAGCLSSMEPPEAPICVRCGQAIRVTTHSTSSLCADCANGRGPKHLDGIRVATVYTRAVRPAVLALKFRGQRRVAKYLAPLMIAPFQSDIHTADMVIPVPLHASRRRERGYNQAELLARAFAASQALPVRTDVLVRERATEAQTHLSQAERRRNVAGAFALSTPTAAKIIAGRRIVLVDDVTTTGSTLDAAAEPLRAAGATSVWGLALARPLAGGSDANDAP
ncbi:MAG TPA: ComF family protein [Ktedonobacterales bacterium]|nr:ComF family protein [Ktedonobacterales bacterium]